MEESSTLLVAGFMRRHCWITNHVNNEFIQTLRDIIFGYAEYVNTIDISLQNVIKNEHARRISSQNHKRTSNYLYNLARNLHLNSQGINLDQNLKIGYILANIDSKVILPMTIVKVKFDKKSKKNTKIFIISDSVDNIYGWINICNKQLCPERYISQWDNTRYLNQYCELPIIPYIHTCESNFNSCNNVIVLDSFNACIYDKIYKKITVEHCKNECRYKPSICTHFGLLV